MTVSRSGGLWFDGTQVRRTRDGVAIGLLHSLPGALGGPFVASASETGVALDAYSRLLSGPINRNPTLVPTQRFGCWQAGAPAPKAFFVVVRDTLVSDGVWACSGSPAGPQPLFARSVRGGKWQVLTRLPGTLPPLLAANGATLAVGLQQSRSRMRVLFLDPSKGLAIGHAQAPLGYVALDGRDRLVVATPSGGAFPLMPRIDVGNSSVSLPPGSTGDYLVNEYSGQGRLIRKLGTSSTQPLVSHGNLVAVQRQNASANRTLVLRSLVTGASTPLVGFDDLGRSLVTLAFDWPTVAIVETVRTQLPGGQYDCRYGAFGPPTPPTATTIDLTQQTAFQPAPPPAPGPTPEQAARCGPPPP